MSLLVEGKLKQPKCNLYVLPQDLILAYHTSQMAILNEL
jgi:hypothetical protein